MISEINNIVLSGHLDPNCDYEFNQDFIWRDHWKKISLLCKSSRFTLLFFMKTRKFIINGVKAMKYVEKIKFDLSQMLCCNIDQISNYRITNITATLDLRENIMLDQLFNKFKLRSIYEPELFPNLKMKLTCGVSAIVAKSGKVILTGCKNENHIQVAENEILLSVSATT